MATQKRIFRSRIDWWVWGVIVLSLLTVLAAALSGSWIIALCYGILLIGLEAVGFFGVWYEIDGDTLVVYNLFHPTRMPISKIAEVRYCRGYIAGPAMSAKRLSIKFTDRSVLKSSMPIEISPADRDGFVEALLAENPAIRVISSRDR